MQPNEQQQTPPLVDDRPETPFYSTQQVSINKDLLETQRELINSVEDLLGITLNPVEAINHLLLEWLPTAKLQAGSHDLQRVQILFELTSFLYQAQHELRSLHFCQNEMKKEVYRG